MLKDLRAFAPALLLCLFMLAGCASVNFDVLKQPSTALPYSNQTTLGQFAHQWSAQHDDQSGFLPLVNASDALGARLALAKAAEKTLDIQYFLIKDDNAGTVITQAMLDAADRGVRVRFLVDDIFTTMPDRNFVLLDQHPNIDIRIFNPISRKGFYWFNYLGTFKDTNRRMHNKSFTVDSAFTIVGGRNIADTYFALEESTIYADFDMLGIGPAAKDIAASFDQYWNFERSIPISDLKKNPQKTLAEVRRDVGARYQDVYEHYYRAAMDSDVLERVKTGENLIAGTAVLLEDDPKKVLSPPSPTQMKLLSQLVPIIESTEDHIIIISPYFIPGQTGINILKTLVDEGKTVTVLTNSLATNNHTSAQAAYAKYRKQLIRAGIHLYELRHSALQELKSVNDGPDDLNMHVKLMFMDDNLVFAGSLNLDPRSFALNTEGGLLIDSPSLQKDMLKNFDQMLPIIAYRMTLSDKGHVRWNGKIDGQSVIKTHAPETSVLKRIEKEILKLAPQGQL